MPDSAEASPAASEAAEQPLESSQASERPDLNTFVAENARALVSLGLLATGIVFVMLGWYGAAHTNILTEQIPYLISGGLLGLGLIIVAGFMASSALVERRTEQLRQDLINAVQMMPMSEPGSNGASRPAGTAQVVALTDGHSYHLAGCPIIEGKDGLREMGARQAIASGLAPCKLCGPE